MKQIIKLCFLLLISKTSAQKNSLQECWNLQVNSTKKQLFSFSYKEKLNVLEHSFYPWEQTNYTIKGQVWCRADNFYKNDTLINRGKVYTSKINLTNDEFVFLDYGDKELYSVTKEMFFEQILKSARYSPMVLINFFFEKKVALHEESDKNFSVYKTVIDGAIVKLYIDKKDSLLKTVTILSDDELFGDVLSTFSYFNYSNTENFYFPKEIKIEKINGKVNDEVIISNPVLTKLIPSLLNKPKGYKLTETSNVAPDIKTSRYNENIHFIELMHTNDRVMVVEFDDFLLVSEAPLNSENGELIIKEAKRIAKNKPIKYFVFGHFHPHYIGGIRPFIHKEAKIICSDINVNYVKYLANSRHTINPDSLEIEHKLLQVELIKDSLMISDGKEEMKIYFIGNKSEHTNDYLIYYFPKKKLLFQDDLVWIKNNEEIKKAGKRQKGLYNAINDLGLNVKTIIQSWPLTNYDVKTIIPFEDIEKSIQVK